MSGHPDHFHLPMRRYLSDEAREYAQGVGVDDTVLLVIVVSALWVAFRVWRR